MGRRAKKGPFDDEFVRKMEEKSAKLGIDVETIKGIYENASNYYVEWKSLGCTPKKDQRGVSVVVLGEHKLTGIRPAELARILGVDYNVVHQWIRYGKVDWRKDEGKLWINVNSLTLSEGLNKTQKITFVKWLEKFYILLDDEFISIVDKRYTEVFDSWK